MKNVTMTGHAHAREQYELEHLARKYGLLARLAKDVAGEDCDVRAADDARVGETKSAT